MAQGINQGMWLHPVRLPLYRFEQGALVQALVAHANMASDAPFSTDMDEYCAQVKWPTYP